MAMIPLSAIPAFHAGRLGAERWAVRHGDDVLSWGELDAQSTRRAWAMKAEGVGQDDIVTLAVPNGNDFYELLFAIWKLGATPHVVSWRLPPAELGAILELARPKLLIAANEESGIQAKPAAFGSNFFRTDTLPEAISTRWKAMSSGGSTGRPKIIMAPQPAQFDPDDPFLRLPSGSTILNPGPLYHNAPLTLTVIGLVRGNAIAGMRKFDAEEALRLIGRHRVSWANFVPTMMTRIWQLAAEVRAKYDMTSLETVWHMAAPMPPELKENWISWLGPERIWEYYGSTEAIGSTTISGGEWLARRGSVGRASPNCTIKVLDESGRELPSGEIGEIYFLPNTGPGSTYSYLGAEAQRTKDGYESVGDYGWMDAEGYLYIADRRTDLIISGGANIYPAEVEHALMAHPAVEVAVIIGLPHKDLGAVVHAIVKPAKGWEGRIDERELAGFLRERLVLYKNPRSYEITLDELRDDAGKVRRSKLRAERIGLGP
jgi:bile acid-coenzyme A ligase